MSGGEEDSPHRKASKGTLILQLPLRARALIGKKNLKGDHSLKIWKADYFSCLRRALRETLQLKPELSGRNLVVTAEQLECAQMVLQECERPKEIEMGSEK